MKSKSKKNTKMRNITAKFSRIFNKAKVFKDRKKAKRKGYRKHKNEDY
jgi:hypothetical protein